MSRPCSFRELTNQKSIKIRVVFVTNKAENKEKQSNDLKIQRIRQLTVEHVNFENR